MAELISDIPRTTQSSGTDLGSFRNSSHFAATSSASYSKVSTHSKIRAQNLTADVDNIVQQAFLRHFPAALIETLGLVLVADGSFGRRMLVAGRSDVDLSFYATRCDYSDLDEVEVLEFNAAKIEFTSEIERRLGVHDLTVDERYQCRLIADVVDEIKASTAGTPSDIKKSAQSITKLCSSRVLCGAKEASVMFPQEIGKIWHEILNNPDLKKQAVRNLVRNGSEIVAEYGLYRNVQDVKARSLTLAPICVGLCFLMETEENAKALASLSGEITERSYFISAVREFLPRNGQILGPAINADLPRAVQKVYGEQPDIVPLTYRSCARVAVDFDFLLEEAARQGLIPVNESANLIDVQRDDLGTVERVKGIFLKPGNVAFNLHYGLVLNSFDTILPELAALDGEPDIHDYQRLTLGEHAVDCTAKLDEFFRGRGDPRFVSLTRELNSGDMAALYFAAALHDCGKLEERFMFERNGGLKIDPEYHADFGSTLAKNAGMRLGFSEEQIETIEALVKNHLLFRHSKGELRENLLQGIVALPESLRSSKIIKMLALLAYADDASTDPACWNGLRANHVYELCHAYTCLLENRPTGLILKNAGDYAEFLFVQHEGRIQDANLAVLRNHLSLFPPAYLGLSPETICAFFQLSKAAAISGEPLVQIVPHHLFDFEQGLGQYRYDVLFVGPDKPFLASNLVEILTKKSLVVHSASFAVNAEQMVFNQYTITSSRDISALIPEFSGLLTQRAKAENLAIPRMSGFTFDSNVKISLSTFEPRSAEGQPTEITVITADKEKLLLRLLVGLNNLNLSIVGAEITTSTGTRGKMMAINRFRVISAEENILSLDNQRLRRSLLLELRDPDELAGRSL